VTNFDVNLPGVNRRSVERIKSILAVTADRLPSAVRRIEHLGVGLEWRQRPQRRQVSRSSRLNCWMHRALLLVLRSIN